MAFPGDVGVAFVCGSHGFVETASQLLVREAGYPRGRVRTERFGPTG